MYCIQVNTSQKTCLEPGRSAECQRSRFAADGPDQYPRAVSQASCAMDLEGLGEDWLIILVNSG